MTRLLVVSLTLLFSLSLQAQVHRWVDEHGRVHFGDSKSAQKVPDAKDISKEVSRVNIDSGSAQAAKLREQRAAQAQADGDLADLERQKNEARKAQYLPMCKRLREEMHIIQSGEPVRFLNDDGSEKVVKESERGEQLAKWQASYAQLQCDEILALE